MSEHDITLALRALGRRLEAEPHADLVPAVLARVRRPRQAPRRGLRTLVLAAAAVVVLAGGLAAASQEVRDRVAGWLDAVGVHLTRVDRVTAPGTAAPEALGDAVTADAARALLGTPIPEPPPLGAPHQFRHRDEPATLSMLWRPRAGVPALRGMEGVGAILSVWSGRDPTDGPVLFKRLAVDTSARVIQLTGPRATTAVWIAGAPHLVAPPEDEVLRFRLGANVLLWQRGDRLLRFESALPLARAVRVARALPEPLAP